MLAGDFEQAWRESDSIQARGEPDPNRFWDGGPLREKRIIIRCLHGLGDTIQFIRYVPLLRRFAAAVTVEAQPKLKTLVSQSEIADRVITWGESEPAWDKQIEVIELPRIFRTTLATIPRSTPYLACAETKEALLSRSQGLRVGIAWKASTFDVSRSVPIERMATLFTVAGCSFYGLQCGPEHTELAPWLPRVSDLHTRIATIHETAQVLRSLDLVISVDTMTAHLAGALAIPVWTLLPYECDWRWMVEREDSPWYPTMRLFRQSAGRDWRPVIARVRKELARLAGQRIGNGFNR